LHKKQEVGVEKSLPDSWRSTCKWGGCRSPAYVWSNGRYVCAEHFREQQLGETVEESDDTNS